MVAEEVILSVPCACLSVCLSVGALIAKPFDLKPQIGGMMFDLESLTLGKLVLKINVIGQSSRLFSGLHKDHGKILRSRSKFKVKFPSSSYVKVPVQTLKIVWHILINV